jgi:hypothetical protein
MSTDGRAIRRIAALERALIAELGQDGATEWLNSGTPSPQDLIHAGNLDLVERLAAKVLFRQPYRKDPNYAAFAPYDPATDIELRPQPGSGPLAQPTQPRRIRLRRSI